MSAANNSIVIDLASSSPNRRRIWQQQNWPGFAYLEFCFTSSTCADRLKLSTLSYRLLSDHRFSLPVPRLDSSSGISFVAKTNLQRWHTVLMRYSDGIS